MNDRIVIDQSKIRIDADLVQRGAPGFPRPLDWWKRNIPGLVNVREDEQGHIVLEANGRRADGFVSEVTPALRRRRLQYTHEWLATRTFLDFSDAVVTEEAS